MNMNMHFQHASAARPAYAYPYLNTTHTLPYLIAGVIGYFRKGQG